MLAEEFRLLLENKFTIDRNKIRYNGIGPRLHEQENKIWPRDSLDHQDESRKILFSLRGLEIPEQTSGQIRAVVETVFGALRKCNINQLFNKCCRLDEKYFATVRFEIHHALDAYTSYKDILDFVHNVIRSIDGISYDGHQRRRNENYVHLIFGSNRNCDIFKKNLKWLVISNARVYKIPVDNFLFCGQKFMDLDQISWLDGLSPEAKYKVYVQVLFALLRFIFELLRRYFYITLSNPYFDKLFYFRYDLWQKLYHKATKKLITDGILLPLKLDPDIMSNLPHFSTSRLKYHLKRDGFRPICTSSKDPRSRKLDQQFEVILRNILHTTANYQKFSLTRLLEGLRHYKESLSSGGGGAKIYFVRADIKNCFQSIDQKLLERIIINRLDHDLDGEPIQIFKMKCKSKRAPQKDIYLWCTDANTLEQRNPSLLVNREENPIERCTISLSEFQARYLRPCIIEPTLRESKRSKNGYILQQGLRQGSAFSPILSSIYIQTAFNEHLGEFLSSDSCRIYRYVDDILFMGTDIDQSRRFMHKMLGGFRRTYNLETNLDKLACNFTYPGLDSRLCCLTEHVVFYRQRICLKTLACSYHFNHETIQLLYSFKLDPYFDKRAMLKCIKAFRLDHIHVDELLNGSELVVTNIFERASLIAHRAATMIIFSFIFSNCQDEEFLVKLVKTTTNKMVRSIGRGLERNVIVNELTYQQVRILVTAAFECTWQRAKLRHRTKELKRLTSVRLRWMMRFLTFKPAAAAADLNSSLTRPVQFEALVCKLMNEFPKSRFAKEVLLPKKDASF